MPTPYSWIWFLSVTIILIIMVAIYYRRYNGLGWIFQLIVLSNVFIVISQFMIWLSPTDFLPFPAMLIAHMGFTAIPFHTIWFLVTMRPPRWQPIKHLTTAYMAIFIGLGLLLINPLFHQFYTLYPIALQFTVEVLKIFIAILATLITIHSIYQQRHTPQGRIPILLIFLSAFSVLFISIGFSLMGKDPILCYPLWVMNYLIAHTLYSITIIRHRILDLKPVALPIIFAQIPDPIIIIDNKKHIIDLNEAARTTWNINLQQHQSLSLDEVIPELTQPDPLQPLIVVNPSHETFYFKWSIHPLKQNNISHGTLYFLRDVTQLHQQSQILQAARQSADEANNAKSRFLANMSHELRSPLHAMLGFTDLLILDSDLSAHQYQRLEAIRYSGQYLLGVIGDILDMAKIEAGKTQLQITDYYLHRLLHGVQDMFQHEARQKHITLRLQIDSNVPHYIHGDEAKLRQILVNLVSNAIKFTKKGGVHIQVTYIDNLVITVTDTGVGIPTEYQETIFSPFYQLDNGFIGGTGLGLPICKEYAEKMGGQIQVESIAEQGSTFTVTLPIDVVPVPQVEASQSDPFHIPHSNNHRVLIIDDRDSDRAILSELLRKANFSIRIAKSGIEALELVSVWKPQTAFIDLDMPEMSGREVAQHLSQHYPDIILIAVTASAYTNMDTLKQEGFNRLLLKPLNTETLLNTMASILQDLPTPSKSTHIDDLIQQVDPKYLQALYERAIVLDIQGTQIAIDQIADNGHLEVANFLQNKLDSFHFRQILTSLPKTLAKNEP